MDLMWFQDELVVAGPDTHCVSIPVSVGDSTWGLRFDPGVAHALLRISVRELRNERVPLVDIVPVPPIHPQRLEDMFIALWDHARPDACALRLATSIDRAARNGETVQQIAARHEMSERSLRRLCDAEFGYGPSMLSQIHRFQAALHLLREGVPPGEVASSTGYADQAHLSREMKRFADQTPSQIAHTPAMADSFKTPGRPHGTMAS
ncbi:hypothetical protein BJF89_02075 [Corynebacterium sp. CNJ-954]|nr:hypothetical protein BJF89_02075 [Corynebacterium sp. CNJ-954]